MNGKTNTGLVEYCRAQLGKPYWYGTYGQTATPALLAAKASQYPSQLTPSRVAKAKSRHMGQRVHDCAGLIKGYLWSDGPDSPPKYSAKQDLLAGQLLTTSYRSGDISSIPELPGVLVFFSGHVGVYAGGGKVIEARGFDHGVVCTELSGRPFKKWGMCCFIDYSGKGDDNVNITLPTLSSGSKNGSVKTAQRLLRSHGFRGASGSELAVDGAFGSETGHAVIEYQKSRQLVADGVVGEKTWKRLLSE